MESSPIMSWDSRSFAAAVASVSLIEGGDDHIHELILASQGSQAPHRSVAGIATAHPGTKGPIGYRYAPARAVRDRSGLAVEGLIGSS